MHTKCTTNFIHTVSSVGTRYPTIFGRIVRSIRLIFKNCQIPDFQLQAASTTVNKLETHIKPLPSLTCFIISFLCIELVLKTLYFHYILFNCLCTVAMFTSYLIFNRLQKKKTYSIWLYIFIFVFVRYLTTPQFTNRFGNFFIWKDSFNRRTFRQVLSNRIRFESKSNSI